MNLLNEIPYKTPIKEILLQSGAINKIDTLDLGKIHIVCDENTVGFISSKAAKTILAGNQKAELTKAQELSKIDCDSFVAVGSGTINDLAKYAAFLAGKPYVIFGTAPSMNGYASGNASLLDNGYKKTLRAAPPQAIYLDLEILKNAPRRLIISGIGDSVCRITCQADNLLASKVTGAEYYNDYFKFMRKYEEDIFDDIAALSKTLIFSGIAMLLAGSSAPASQAEHMLAHYMEMMQPNAAQSYHGEQIAITTITTAKLQQKLLESDFEINQQTFDEQIITDHFGQELAPFFIEQTRAKYSQIKPQTISAKEFSIPNPQEIEAKLKSIGAPLKPEDIGWDNAVYADALKHTKLTRDRFTFLDLA